MENITRAAAYIRVSTDDQTEYSPAAQLRAIEDYAAKNGMRVEKVYTDEGISGRTAKKRPAFMEMVGEAKRSRSSRAFDVILVHKFDRFSRNREESIVYKSMLRKECGVRVISITEHMEDDRFSVILEAILEAMAEYYSLNLADEVKKGMTEKADRGEYMSVAPFGYEWKNGSLVINEEEGRIVRFIFESFASGEKNRGQLAAYLNSMGVKTHRGNRMEYRTIDYILKNVIYKGYVRWCPTGKRDYRVCGGEKSIVRKGVHMPIVSEELFDSVQKKIKAESGHGRRRGTNRSHPLSGIIKCSACGASLSYSGGTGSLQCVNYQHSLCPVSHSITEKKAMAAIMEEIDSMFGKIPIDGYVRHSSGYKAYEEERLLWEKKLRKIKERQKRLKEAYLDGVMELEEYKAERAECIKQAELYKSLSEKKDCRQCEGKRAEGRLTDILSSSDISEREKNNALRQIFAKVVYNRQERSFTFYYYL